MEKLNEKLQKEMIQFLSSNYEVFKKIVNNHSNEMPISLREECLAFIREQEEIEIRRKQNRENLEQLAHESNDRLNKYKKEGLV